MIRRRSLLAAPALILARKADAAFISFGVAQPTAFPGQPIGGSVPNPVGFAATPGWPGSFQNGALSLGSPTTLSALAALTGGVIPNGTPGNPNQIKYLDFNANLVYPGATNYTTSNGTYPTGGVTALHDVSFIGCRFQAQSIENANIDCFTGGPSNITFSYCSITPPTSLHAAPLFPGTWPSASVGTGVVGVNGHIDASQALYCIPYQDASAFGISPGTFVSSSSFIIIDHCDIWGCADAINLAATSIGSITVTDNWAHDLRLPFAPAWNAGITYPPSVSAVAGTDGVIYISTSFKPNVGFNPVGDGGTHWIVGDNHGGDHSNGCGLISGNPPPPTSVVMKHNTFASLGNVNAISLQGSRPGSYSNWTITNNYIAGFAEPARIGEILADIGTGMVFTDNIIATDIWWANGRPISNDVSAAWLSANGNIWRRNRISVYPGSDAAYFASYISANSAVFAANPSPYVLPTARTAQVGATDWAR